MNENLTPVQTARRASAIASDVADYAARLAQAALSGDGQALTLPQAGNLAEDVASLVRVLRSHADRLERDTGTADPVTAAERASGRIRTLTVPPCGCDTPAGVLHTCGPTYTTPGDPAERVTLEPVEAEPRGLFSGHYLGPHSDPAEPVQANGTDLPDGTTGVIESGARGTVYVCEDHDRRAVVQARTGNLVHLLDSTLCRA